MSEHTNRIVVEPGRRSGHAVVRGTRITVEDILSMLVAGMTTDEVLADFPELERADIAAALARLGDSEPDIAVPGRRRPR